MLSFIENNKLLRT